MKLALISDIHGNLPALEAVLAQIDQLEISNILCLGDVVGYGPFPNECIDHLIQRNIPMVLGNHDAAVIGKQAYSLFREPNASLLKWTEKNLRDKHLAYLNACEYTYHDPEYDFLAVHSSPVEPKRWTYIQSAIVGRNLLKDFRHTFIFVGHTHVPGVVADRLGVFSVKKGNRYLINPGSVGQPRDSDQRASFGVVDLAEMSYQNYRINFNKEINRVRFHEIGVDASDARRMLG